MTYVYEKYDRSMARGRFQDMNRVDHFGYDGIDALFDYLEEIANDTGEPIEFDVVALCCEYARYETLEEFNRDYDNEYASVGDIRDVTTVIPINGEGGPFIVQSF